MHPPWPPPPHSRQLAHPRCRAALAQDYFHEISPEAARDAFDDEGAEGLAAQREAVKDLHERKLTFLAKIGIDFLAAQLEMSVADFLERFDPENTTAERARVNWTRLARDAQGPTRVGDRLRVAANGGQGWVQLLRASGLVNMDLLCARAKGSAAFIVAAAPTSRSRSGRAKSRWRRNLRRRACRSCFRRSGSSQGSSASVRKQRRRRGWQREGDGRAPRW